MLTELLSTILALFSLRQVAIWRDSGYNFQVPVPLHQHAVEEERFASFWQSSVPLPFANPTKSFWTHGEPNANPLAAEGSLGEFTTDADIVIIGSGITGVGVAYHLGEMLPNGMDAKIVILEARDFCSGATGRNGGHLTPTKFQAFRANSEKHGTLETLKSLSLESHTADSILSILAASQSEEYVDLVHGYHLDLYFSHKEEEESKADFQAAADAGANLHKVQFLSSEETAKAHGPFFPSVHFQGHNLWPLKLVTRLFYLAQDKLTSKKNSTLVLHTHTPVTKITPLDITKNATISPRRWLLHTPRGEIRSRIVIHATNAYAAHLLPFYAPSPGRKSIVPVRGQVIATRAAVTLKRLTKISYGANDGFEYWFPRPINRSQTEAEEKPLVILGGGREAADPNFEFGVADDSTLNSNVSKTLRGFLPAIYPKNWFPHEREPEMEWTGIMGFTESRNPLVGPVVNPTTGSILKGQYIAAGYSGHGMPRALGCSEALVQLLITDMLNQTWDIPDWFPHHFLTTWTHE